MPVKGDQEGNPKPLNARLTCPTKFFTWKFVLYLTKQLKIVYIENGAYHRFHRCTLTIAQGGSDDVQVTKNQIHHVQTKHFLDVELRHLKRIPCEKQGNPSVAKSWKH